MPKKKPSYNGTISPSAIPTGAEILYTLSPYSGFTGDTSIALIGNFSAFSRQTSKSTSYFITST